MKSQNQEATATAVASSETTPGAYDSNRWWPAGLPEWIAEQVAAGDELFTALDKGLRSFGWPAYNVPQPLPRENSWPALALMLAQRVRDNSATNDGAAVVPGSGS